MASDKKMFREGDVAATVPKKMVREDDVAATMPRKRIREADAEPPLQIIQRTRRPPRHRMHTCPRVVHKRTLVPRLPPPHHPPSALCPTNPPFSSPPSGYPPNLTFNPMFDIRGPAMSSRGQMLFFSSLIGIAGLIAFAGTGILSSIVAHIYEHLLGGRPLPALTAFMLKFNSLLGVPALIVVFSTCFFASYFPAWMLRDRLPDAFIAICILSVTICTILCYVLISITSLALPFVPISGGFVTQSTEAQTSEVFSDSMVLAAAVGYSAVLTILAWRLRW